jgi:hypothetical protein
MTTAYADLQAEAGEKVGVGAGDAWKAALKTAADVGTAQVRPSVCLPACLGGLVQPPVCRPTKEGALPLPRLEL